MGWNIEKLEPKQIKDKLQSDVFEYARTYQKNEEKDIHSGNLFQYIDYKHNPYMRLKLLVTDLVTRAKTTGELNKYIQTKEQLTYDEAKKILPYTPEKIKNEHATNEWKEYNYPTTKGPFVKRLLETYKNRALPSIEANKDAKEARIEKSTFYVMYDDLDNGENKAIAVLTSLDVSKDNIEVKVDNKNIKIDLEFDAVIKFTTSTENGFGVKGKEPRRSVLGTFLKHEDFNNKTLLIDDLRGEQENSPFYKQGFQMASGLDKAYYSHPMVRVVQPEVGGNNYVDFDDFAPEFEFDFLQAPSESPRKKKKNQNSASSFFGLIHQLLNKEFLDNYERELFTNYKLWEEKILNNEAALNKYIEIEKIEAELIITTKTGNCIRSKSHEPKEVWDIRFNGDKVERYMPRNTDNTVTIKKFINGVLQKGVINSLPKDVFKEIAKMHKVEDNGKRLVIDSSVTGQLPKEIHLRIEKDANLVIGYCIVLKNVKNIDRRHFDPKLPKDAKNLDQIVLLYYDKDKKLPTRMLNVEQDGDMILMNIDANSNWEKYDLLTTIRNVFVDDNTVLKLTRNYEITNFHRRPYWVYYHKAPKTFAFLDEDELSESELSGENLS